MGGTQSAHPLTVAAFLESRSGFRSESRGILLLLLAVSDSRNRSCRSAVARSGNHPRAPRLVPRRPLAGGDVSRLVNTGLRGW